MYRHMSEAMTLNHARQPVYASLSGGKSNTVSEAMISFEEDLIGSASFADAVAYLFQLNGIPILCVDYVSMANTPELSKSYKNGAPDFSLFRQPDMKTMKETLTAAIEQENFALVVELTNRYIEELDKEPRFNCMVRHFLESARRVAGLAPQYQAMTRSSLVAYGVKFISKKVLEGHVKGLDESVRIDVLAAPVQAGDLPIVCQDVPPIPPAPVIR